MLTGGFTAQINTNTVDLLLIYSNAAWGADPPQRKWSSIQTVWGRTWRVHEGWCLWGKRGPDHFNDSDRAITVCNQWTVNTPPGHLMLMELKMKTMSSFIVKELMEPSWSHGQASECSTVGQNNLLSPLSDLQVQEQVEEAPPRLNQTPRSRLSPTGRSGPVTTLG